MNILMLFMASFILQAASETPKLVLVRNGESEWMKLNLFLGWSDDPLSEQGRKEAIQGGKLLKEGGYYFDVCYTSILKRALQTTFHLLDEIDQLHIPIMKGFNLNDRHYGALQGLKKKEIEEKYGSEQVNSWKRSFDIPPPALDEKDERNPANQPKYKKYPKNILPLHESFKDTNDRVIPYFSEVIFPDIQSGKNVLITAHGDSLKAIVKYLDNIPEQDIIDLEIPNGIPLVYEFDNDLNPLKSYYLGNHESIKDTIKSFNFIESNIKIIFVEKLNKMQEREVWELLKKSDHDFLPPLSARTNTVHKLAGYNSNEKVSEGPVKYFEEIKKENFLLILNNGKIEGFMSFIKDYPLEFDQGTVIVDYITTILIDSNCRNKGYTKKLYDVILTERKETNKATRTWSTNFTHIHILDKLGFKLAQRDLNDRGPNIDTVYYLKTPSGNIN